MKNYTLLFLPIQLFKDVNIYWPVFSEHGNSDDGKLRLYVFCVFLGWGGNDNWCCWNYGLDRYGYCSISNHFSSTAQCVSHRSVIREIQYIMLYNLIILPCCEITRLKFGH
jgi:hypothetical protein